MSRPWQPKVVERSAQALRGGLVVSLDSPTGSGKTLMALGIIEAMRGAVSDAFVAVRTVNGIVPYDRDLGRMKARLNVTYRVGKRHTCPYYRPGDEQSSLVCGKCLDSSGKLSPRRRVDTETVARLISEGDAFSDLRQKLTLGTADDVCLYFSLRGVAAPVVLMTYPYFLDPGIKMSSGTELSESLLVVDEAHNLESASGLESRLSRRAIERAWSSLTEVPDALGLGQEQLVMAENVLKELSRVVAVFAGEDGRYRDKEQFKSALAEIPLDRLRDASSVVEIARSMMVSPSGTDAFSNPLLPITRFIDSLDGDLELFTEGRDGLALRSLDPARALEVLGEPKALLLMSGTMPPAKYIRAVWGLNRKIEEIRVERDYPVEYNSVFPPNSRRNVVVPGISSEFHGRTPALWRRYANLVDAAYERSSKDVVLVCCPSYQILREVSDNLNSPKILETPWSDYAQVLDSVRGKTVLMTVARGKFAEGVEFLDGKGSRIDVVVIIGMPYPVPNDYHKMRARRIMKRLGVPSTDRKFEFEYFSREPALVAVRQAIGRALRTPTDEVLAVLGDERFGEPFWRERLAA